MTRWQDSIASYAQKFGVPAKIINTVIAVESNGNPSAIGDNGTSFGLLQLHVGGQLGNTSERAALDPSTNLAIGLPYIARGYTQAGPFQDTLAWWKQFAAASGHPGGAPGETITNNEAVKLQSYYESGIAQSADGSFSGGSSTATSVKSGAPLDFFQNVGYELLLLILAIAILFVGIFFLTQ